MYTIHQTEKNNARCALQAHLVIRGCYVDDFSNIVRMTYFDVDKYQDNI